MLTLEQVAQALPPNLKGAATPAFVDKINNITQDPLFAEAVRNNFVHYTSVLKDGKFKTEDYLHAVVYVSYKLMGFSNRDAYEYTFPARVSALVAQGLSAREISAYVSAYNKGKLVSLITEQSLVPSWVLNNHMFQEALNVQFELMQNAASEKVRTEAANSILTHLKRPEAIKAQLDVTVNDTSGMTELKEAVAKLAQEKLRLIELGVPTQQIAAMPLIEGEATVVSSGLKAPS